MQEGFFSFIVWRNIDYLDYITQGYRYFRMEGTDMQLNLTKLHLIWYDLPHMSWGKESTGGIKFPLKLDIQNIAAHAIMLEMSILVLRISLSNNNQEFNLGIHVQVSKYIELVWGCIFNVSKLLQFSVITRSSKCLKRYCVKSNIDCLFEGVKRWASSIQIKMAFFLGDVRNWDLWHEMVGKCTMYNK